MTILHPGYLVAGLALAGLIVLAFSRHARRRRQLADFLGGSRAAQGLARFDLSRLHVERIVLLGFAAVAIAAAAAEPRLRMIPPTEQTHSVVIAIDVSASMQASDVAPTRLARAVEIANELLDALGDDRVGLLLYAGNAYPLARPTTDHDALRFLLSGVTPTMATAHDPGSLLSVAIRRGTTLWPTEVQRGEDRSLILIGDGEPGEPEQDVMAAAEEAAGRGIRIHTIGVGTSDGAGMVLARAQYQVGGPVLDAETGTLAISQLNTQMLELVAEAGGGRYVHADDDPVSVIEASLETPLLTGPWWTRYDLPGLLIVAALAAVLLESLLDIRLPGWRPAMVWRGSK